jgi:outer membrane protein OmpA-like peptidoglycan-associated protein
MSRSQFALPWLPWLLALASCSTPPKPPTVDESRKRPVNTAMAIELQTCRNDLDNIRIVATEHQRRADAGSVALAQMVQQQLTNQERVERMLEREQSLVRGVAASTPSPRNLLVPVHFAFGSAQVSIPEVDAARVVAEARAAPLVLLRGRTDGTVESPGESHVARQRAAAIESFLVRAGVGRERIRTTWQPVGDHAADNTTPEGRSHNRRVEIEIYRAAPVSWTSGALTANTSQREDASP